MIYTKLQNKTYGKIEKGVLKISRREEFSASFKTWMDCRVEVIVKKLYKQRSSKQNSYYWGVIIDCYLRGILETTGKPMGHEFANRATGEVLFIPATLDESLELSHKELKVLFCEFESTADNSTIEQEEYHENCRNYIKFCFNIEVPLPEEPLKIPFEK